MLDSLNNEVTQEIERLKEQLNNSYSLINSITDEIRNLSCAYLIAYRGKSINAISGDNQEEAYEERVYLKTDYQINTSENGWDEYIQDEAFQSLLKEVDNYIYHKRYTHFDLVHIVRLSSS